MLSLIMVCADRTYQDHAAGSLLITEASGLISNSLGEPLDFGLGTTLGENFGVVAAPRGVHEFIIEGIRRVREKEKEAQSE